MTTNIITTTSTPVKEAVLMPKDAKDLLKELYLFRSYSGFEEPLRNGIINFLNKLKVPYVNYNGNILGLNYPGKPLFSAHMDMVNTESYKLKGAEHTVTDPVFTIDDKACLRLYRGPQADGHQTSLGADDKNGIWVILMLLREGFEINFAFCHSEEVGGIGSSQVIKDKECAQQIEQCSYGVIIDRRNANDIIGFENKYCMALDDRIEDFAKQNGFKYTCARGSISDADQFSQFIECVNLSCGYYEPHTSREYTNLNELWNTFLFCKKLLTDFSFSSVSPKRMQSFKNCRSPYSTYTTTTTTYTSNYTTTSKSKKEEDDDYYDADFYRSAYYDQKSKKYVNLGTASKLANQKKTSDQEAKTTIVTTTTSDHTTSTDEDALGELVAQYYLQEAMEDGMTYAAEIEADIMPLYSEQELPPSTHPSDIINYTTCKKCKKKLMLLQKSIDELYTIYSSVVAADADKIYGICTDCHALNDITEDIKYLL